MRRDVAAIELDAVDDFDLRLARRSVFDGNHAVVADLVHGVGDGAADFRVAIGCDGGDLCDLDNGDYFPRVLLELPHDSLYCAIDAALKVHGIYAGCYRSHAIAENPDALLRPKWSSRRRPDKTS